MQIGVPREIKQDEYRVGMIPSGVEELTRAGHRVVIETGAGLGNCITDKHYTEAGAQIAASGTASIEAATDTPTPRTIEPSSSACGTISRPLMTSHAARRTAEPSERSSGA